jgi:hypothetical protein
MKEESKIDYLSVDEQIENNKYPEASEYLDQLKSEKNDRSIFSELVKEKRTRKQRKYSE